MAVVGGCGVLWWWVVVVGEWWRWWVGVGVVMGGDGFCWSEVEKVVNPVNLVDRKYS